MLNYAQHEIRNILESAARTTAQTMAAPIVNIGGWRGIRILFNAPTQTTSASNTVTVYAWDENGNKFSLGATPAITAQGSTVLTIYPGLPTATTTINNVLSRLFSVDVAVGNANSMTYSMEIEMLP
jgi:hypothetical protein